MEPTDPPATSCDKCGEPHNPKHCDGHRRSDGKQCGNGKGKRTDHPGFGNCYMHLGNTANHKKHAAGEMVKVELARFLDDVPIERLDDPVGTYERKIAEAVAVADFLLGRFREMAEADDLVQFTNAHGEQMRALVSEARAWHKDSVDALERAHRLGLDTRRVEIDETRTEITFAAMRDALAETLTEFGVRDHDRFFDALEARYRAS